MCDVSHAENIVWCDLKFVPDLFTPIFQSKQPMTK